MEMRDSHTGNSAQAKPRGIKRVNTRTLGETRACVKCENAQTQCLRLAGSGTPSRSAFRRGKPRRSEQTTAYLRGYAQTVPRHVAALRSLFFAALKDGKEL
jgi:hypothetical protein